MKIALVCNEYPPHPRIGGIGIFTHTLAHALVDAGHAVTVLGYGGRGGQRDDGGVRVVTLPESTMRGAAWLVNRRRLYSWLKQHAKARQIDLVELPEYQGLLPFAFRWCPVVVRLHSASIPAKRSHRLLEQRALRLHRNWIAVSRHIAEETKTKYAAEPSRFSVVYNPVRCDEQDEASPPELPDDYVLFAGTVQEAKGVYVLAEAARSFLADYPNLHLVYAGGLKVENGRLADATIREILGERFADRVHFTGLLDHASVLACMRRARVFAFPSKREAFGLVPAEAMACGVPVVYSRLHAGPEVIDDGVTGLLADPHSPADVAEKVKRLLDDPGLAARLGENGKRAARDRFSTKRCVVDTVTFYETCLSAWEQRT